METGRMMRKIRMGMIKIISMGKRKGMNIC